MSDPTARTLRGIATRVERERRPHVGFIGCPTAGRVLRVGLPNARQRVCVRCPLDGCNETHDTGEAMPRPRCRGEEVDVEIEDAQPPPPAASKPRKSPPGAGPSDEDVLAAIPAIWTPATEVAEALDYGSPKALMNRLRRIRKRAEAKGARLPFELEQRSGRPTLVRRTDPDTVKSEQ